MDDFSFNSEHKDVYSQRAWVEINLSNLYNNLKTDSSYLPSTTQIMTVVKADAYDH